MRTGGVALIAAASVLLAGCGAASGSGESAPPDCSSARSALEDQARKLDSLKLQAAAARDGTGTPEQLAAKKQLPVEVRTYSHIIVDSAECFEPKLVAQARTYLDGPQGR
jgi:predicted small secreted protein